MDQKNQGTILLLKGDGNYTRRRIRRLRIENGDGPVEDYPLFLGSVLIEEEPETVTLAISKAPEKTVSLIKDATQIQLPLDRGKFNEVYFLYALILPALYLLHRLLTIHGW